MDHQEERHNTGPVSSIVGDLRALEWELMEILRRVEVVRDQLHELQERHLELESGGNASEDAS